MKKVILAVIVLAFTMTGCKNVNKSGSAISQVMTTTDNHKTNQVELKTKTGKDILIKETHPDGVSISKVQIQTKGFKIDQTIEVGNIDPIVKTQLYDLDLDGYEELYIFTQSAGSGSAGKFYVYASDKDKRLVGIRTSVESDSIIAKMKGYMGHDSYSINKDTLIRTFPLYKAKDKNNKPTGGTERIYYQLSDNKIGILKIESSSVVISNTILDKLRRLKRKLHLGSN